MHFTEKGELQPASRSSRERFLRDWHWVPTEDLCIDVWAPDENPTPYPWPKEIKPGRELPDHYAEEAVRYIKVITLAYPFQMRQYLGEPMWMRFCEMWAATADVERAMRAI